MTSPLDRAEAELMRVVALIETSPTHVHLPRVLISARLQGALAHLADARREAEEQHTDWSREVLEVCTGKDHGHLPSSLPRVVRAAIERAHDAALQEAARVCEETSPLLRWRTDQTVDREPNRISRECAAAIRALRTAPKEGT